jgi:EAL domain-containing protein (putative c-di-GMP-specific phosphodiesterase class I)
MLKVIKIALKNDKILPFFQPIHHIGQNRTFKYEALVRMFDEDGNLITPGPYFLDVAKKGKLYSQVTKILFKKVIEKIREERCEISINISSLDIEDQQMSEYLLKLLKENSDITHMMTFELLEDKDTQDYAYVNKFIDKVRKLGIKIAIDDFGSGYSNFIRIIEFKPDIIKIDGSLIENIAQSESNKKTVEAIKIFAQKIGAQTVAEYVTNERTFDIVKELGIDYAQGFYIGKPQPEFLDEKVAETV